MPVSNLKLVSQRSTRTETFSVLTLVIDATGPHAGVPSPSCALVRGWCRAGPISPLLIIPRQRCIVLIASSFTSHPLVSRNTMPTQYRALSQSDVDHFLEHGFVHLKDTFSPDKAQNWMTNMWTRLGMSPDASRWPIERCNMAGHTGEDVKEFAPKVWDAMCDLLGSGERINGQGSTWSDALVVNLGDVEGSTQPLGPRELNGWHVDGDFFTHFLDSPEQALLVVPLLTDVEEGQGPTVGATDSIAHIAKYLVRLLVLDRTGCRD
jgi:hypothetical protein